MRRSRAGSTSRVTGRPLPGGIASFPNRPIAQSPNQPIALRITYVFDGQIPDTEADTEQVANTVAALGRRGMEMTLLIPGTEDGPGNPAALAEYYHLEGTLRIEHLRWRYRGLRLLEKWSHARRAAGHPTVTGAELAYTRNLPAAWTLLGAGHRVVYEHFRPWGDQVPPLQPVLRHILRHPNLVGAIFHSHHTLTSYHRLGIPDARMMVAHNGWDPARMTPRLGREEARALTGLAPEPFTVVYTGRMNLRKGLDILLAAARAAPEIQFVLVGSEGEGPVEREARTIANIRVVPWQRSRDLPPWLFAADVLVVPPSLEPLQRHGTTVLPIKLFLYLAAGRALLAPRAPDTAELLTDDRNAALVEPGDVGATVAALRGLAASPERAARLSAGALATALDLTWDARGGRIVEFLSRRRTAPPDAFPTPDPWRASRWLGEVGRWVLGG